jgi:hypothetical protein
MNLFHEGELRAVLEAQKQELKSEVESQSENYLLNVNEPQLIAHFVAKYRIEPVVLHEDKIYADDTEELIPAERFDNFRFHVRAGHSYKKQVVRYHVPYSGIKDLLRCAPSSRLMWTEDVRVEQGEILFEVINWDDDVETIKRRWNEFLTPLKTQVANSAKEVSAFNSTLEKEIAAVIQKRKAELLKKRNLLASLGIPLKKAGDVPATFAVPPLKKKVIIQKPTASSAPFAPEPTLDDATYGELLKIIHDTGVEIERHPSIYEGKDEETLRDHFLMVLSPHFDSVSGETFNKTGKTDILVRHEGRNLFVAECGIWKGAKQFLGKIDQLLSYLTWRDSKTALISFVRNKEFSSVLETIKTEILKHASFVKELPAAGEGWFQYEFTLKDDPSRAVRMAVMCFHFP